MANGLWDLLRLAGAVVEAAAKIDDAPKNQGPRKSGPTSGERRTEKSAQRQRQTAASSEKPSAQETGWKLERTVRDAEWALRKTTYPAIKEIEREIVAALAGHDAEYKVRHLERHRAMLFADPSQEPMLADGDGRGYVEAAREEVAGVRAYLLPRFDELKRRIVGEARETAAAIKPGEVLAQRIADFVVSSIDRARDKASATLDKRSEAVDKLETELARFVDERAQHDAEQAFPDDADAEQVLTAFRRDMRLSEADLTRLIAALTEADVLSLAPILALSVEEQTAIAARWTTDGVPAADVALIAQAFELHTVYVALRDMGLEKAASVKELKPLSERASQLTGRVPDAPLRLDPVSAARLVRAGVLASECSIGPFTMAPLRNERVEFDFHALCEGPAAPFDREAITGLIERLEGSAAKTIAKPAGDTAIVSFRPWHLGILAGLREALGIEAPSPAQTAWQDYLAEREAARERVVASAAPFWRALFTEMLDRRVAVNFAQADLHEATLPLGALDLPARQAILADVSALLATTNARELALAWRSPENEAPAERVWDFIGHGKMRLLRHLTEVLGAPPHEQDGLLAPFPPLPELGEFAALLPGSSPVGFRGSPLKEIEGWLVENRFGEVAEALRGWAEKAPASSLRTALLETRWDTLRIDDWRPIEKFVANPETVAIKLNFSGHVTGDMTDPALEIPFEGGWLGAEDFPGLDDLSPVRLRELCAHYPRPWTGRTRDGHIYSPIKGLGEPVVALNAWANEVKDDWPEKAYQYNQAVAQLARLTIYAHANSVLECELGTRRFARAVPFIVGDHDFGTFVSVLHMSRAA